MTNGKSIGSVKDYTPNYKFIIPKFDIATWHDYMEKNFRNIDALFYNLFGINNYSGEWTKLTQYKVNQVLFIGEDKKDGEDTEYSGRLVKVLQDHITDNSEYFNIYYEQHPEYYELFADAPTAQVFAQQAQQSAAEAKTSETNAKESETNSKSSEQIATQKATEASGSASTAQQIVDTFESNVNSYTESFNSNTESKLNAYNANDVEKTAAFNQNYTEKLQSFTINATEKTEIVNNLVQQAQTSATNVANSEQKAKESENNAEIWAEGTDEQVQSLGGEKSAKGWAESINVSNLVNRAEAQSIDGNKTIVQRINFNNELIMADTTGKAPDNPPSASAAFNTLRWIVKATKGSTSCYGGGQELFRIQPMINPDGNFSVSVSYQYGDGEHPIIFGFGCNADGSNPGVYVTGKNVLTLEKPSTRYDNIPVQANDATYTAPENGWFVVRGDGAGADGQIYLNRTDGGVGSMCIMVDNTWKGIPAAPIPVKKGDVVRLSYTRATVTTFRFYYDEGVK